jgi:hypothetical protein
MSGGPLRRSGYASRNFFPVGYATLERVGDAMTSFSKPPPPHLHRRPHAQRLDVIAAKVKSPQ